MTIGLLTVELHLPEADSLKSKRFVLKSLKDRVRNKFNVSIAEIEFNDLWQRCQVAIACVGNETKIVNQTLDGVLSLILSLPSVELIGSKLELL
jgi:hypothetical protein